VPKQVTELVDNLVNLYTDGKLTRPQFYEQAIVLNEQVTREKGLGKRDVIGLHLCNTFASALAINPRAFKKKVAEHRDKGQKSEKTSFDSHGRKFHSWMVDMVVQLSDKMAEENTSSSLQTSDIKDIFKQLILQELNLRGKSSWEQNVSDNILNQAQNQFEERTDALNPNKKDENRIDAESSVKNLFAWIAVCVCMQLGVDPACILNTDSTQKTLGQNAAEEEKIHVPKGV
jgi:hypothetical protein